MNRVKQACRATVFALAFGTSALCSLAAPIYAGEIAPIRLDDSFPADQRADFQAVANDLWEVLRQKFPVEPPAGERPIRVTYRPDGPPLCDATSDEAEYRIYLTASDRRYAQFVYQLGHELGHVMTEPRRANAVGETLAEAVALMGLAEMERLWRIDPPYPHWKPYAAAFGEYRAQNVRRRLNAFPDAVQKAVRGNRWDEVALYLRYRLDEQDRRIEQRDLNALAALALLSGEVDWLQLVGAPGLTVPSPKEDPRFRRDLNPAASLLPDVMRRTGRAKATTLVVVTSRGEPPEVPFDVCDRFQFAADDKTILLLETDDVDTDQLAVIAKLHGVTGVHRVVP